ncbi:MAG: glutathione S-transferase N-terminal domain-containing protein [Actinomycetota bacterium]|nr:glutathione S-transferase N-terminal domain-containing protein [Actinomycetota bacterium]
MRHAGTQDSTIDIYTLPWCPHCARAKALLTRRELHYHEVDGSGQGNFRARLRELTGGATVPQIVINGTPVGGADRLARLDRMGLLQSLARGEPFPVTRERRRTSPSLLARWIVGRMRGRRVASPFESVHIKLDHAGRIVGTHQEISKECA